MKIFKATDAMRVNQSKGRAWRKEKEASNKDVTFKSFHDEFSLDDVKEVYSFLNKQKTKINKYNVDGDNLPTNIYCDWLDAGANAALSWSQEILKQEGIIKTKTSVSKSTKDDEEVGKFVDNVSVFKSTNDELQQVTFVVLEPHASDEEFDLHKDTNDATEVRKACESFNKYCRKANLLHLVETTGFDIIESYITPVEFVINDEFIKKGTWLATLQVHEDWIWNGVKDGTFNGLSIQALAATEQLEGVEDE